MLLWFDSTCCNGHTPTVEWISMHDSCMHETVCIVDNHVQEYTRIDVDVVHSFVLNVIMVV